MQINRWLGKIQNQPADASDHDDIIFIANILAHFIFPAFIYFPLSVCSSTPHAFESMLFYNFAALNKLISRGMGWELNSIFFQENLTSKQYKINYILMF